MAVIILIVKMISSDHRSGRIRCYGDNDGCGGNMRYNEI